MGRRGRCIEPEGRLRRDLNVRIQFVIPANAGIPGPRVRGDDRSAVASPAAGRAARIPPGSRLAARDLGGPRHSRSLLLG